MWYFYFSISAYLKFVPTRCVAIDEGGLIRRWLYMSHNCSIIDHFSWKKKKKKQCSKGDNYWLKKNIHINNHNYKVYNFFLHLFTVIINCHPIVALLTISYSIITIIIYIKYQTSEMKIKWWEMCQWCNGSYIYLKWRRSCTHVSRPPTSDLGLFHMTILRSVPWSFWQTERCNNDSQQFHLNSQQYE